MNECETGCAHPALSVRIAAGDAELSREAADRYQAAQATPQATLATKRQLDAEAQLQDLRQNQQTGWKLIGLGADCPGHDIAESSGEEPESDLCKDQTRTAICWDGSQFINGSRFGGQPWCVYKAIEPKSCVGGASPGRKYSCMPPG